MLEVRIKLDQGSEVTAWMAVDISVDLFRIRSWFLVPSVAVWKTVETPSCNGWRSSQVSMVTVFGPKTSEWFEEVAVVARQSSGSIRAIAGVAVRSTVEYW
jgi:hypothetical protein